MKWILLLDVGGSSIKGAYAAIPERNSGFEPPLHTVAIHEAGYFPARANGSKEEILCNFLSIFEKIADKIEDSAKIVEALVFAFPGDFDYEKGIPLLRGIEKYEAIYGVDLKKEFRTMLSALENSRFFSRNCTMLFLHDIAAFLLGELDYLPHRYERIMALCIGTGAGSAFYAGGAPVDQKYPGVPYKGWIYDTPFKASIIDDYISIRGLGNLSHEILGRRLSGKELADAVCAGDENARRVFEAFGEMIAPAIAPFIDSFRPSCFILGGQMAKSADIFMMPLKEICAKNGVELVIENKSSEIAMSGLLKFFLLQM